MKTGRFSAPEDDSGSEESRSDSRDGKVPSLEDLSSVLGDEIIVLEAVYCEDFTRTKGIWGCPRFEVACRPPDVDNVGSSLL